VGTRCRSFQIKIEERYRLPAALLTLTALLAGLMLRALLLLTRLALSTLLLLAGLVLSALLRIARILFVCHRDVLRAREPPAQCNNPREHRRFLGLASNTLIPR
jgi:hypothetical protein